MNRRTSFSRESHFGSFAGGGRFKLKDFNTLETVAGVRAARMAMKIPSSSLKVLCAVLASFPAIKNDTSDASVLSVFNFMNPFNDSHVARAAFGAAADEHHAAATLEERVEGLGRVARRDVCPIPTKATIL